MITQNWTRFTDKDCYLSMVGIMIGFNHVFGIVLQVLSSYNGTHRLTGIAGLLCPCYYHVVQSLHYNDVIMGAIASKNHQPHHYLLNGLYQSSASLAFVLGIHRRPVNSPHKWLVTRKMFPFDDVIMSSGNVNQIYGWSIFKWVVVTWIEVRCAILALKQLITYPCLPNFHTKWCWRWGMDE